MFVVPQDFDENPDFSIPNMPEDSFQDFIDKKEEEVLRKIFGTALYNEFVANFEEGNAYLEDRFRNIIEGADYTYNEVLYNYAGIKAFLVPYIYGEWLAKTWKTWTRAGVVEAVGENSTKVSPRVDIVRARRETVRVIGDICNKWHTLYGLMYVTKDDDYPDWVFCPPAHMNKFDI
jgi:hypothetical protein